MPAVVIRDKRRIDPVTLELRDPDRAGKEGAGGGEETGSGRLLGAVDRLGALEARLAERTADLQRLKAEYDNYRKRVRRDRLAVREIAVVNVLTGLLPVLDAIDRAREYDELTDGLRAVADALESQLAALGLQSFGNPGEPFDPTRHEALAHEPSAEVEEPTCTTVLRPGYRVGQHLLRPAQVVVGTPPAPAREG
ncbi:nucleotide exchange factor GrpE [Kitasatospora sp. NPDC052896]|uniref:nucleotide exchange factor GrpE n=1 Tax=Kitasatospora sp. NPDC052896 TaxID=3364061 RepID=UPI0037C57FA3